jgi:hypothetical protein
MQLLLVHAAPLPSFCCLLQGLRRLGWRDLNGAARLLMWTKLVVLL